MEHLSGAFSFDPSAMRHRGHYWFYLPRKGSAHVHMLVKTPLKNSKRKGQALVEYALIVAAVALTCIVAITMFGHKTADVIAVGAGLLPGAHAEDNRPIQTEALFATTEGTENIQLDTTNMAAPTTGVDRYQELLGAGGAAQFVAAD
jgi:hypothetical protein